MDWQETVTKPEPPLWEAKAVVGAGLVTVRESSKDAVPYRTKDERFSAHVNWCACWTTQERAKKIGEMALWHLRQLEAEIAALDDLPPNATLHEVRQ